ncbi:MAG: DUF2188 domain-containing protein [Janthinobacterium lividum]
MDSGSSRRHVVPSLSGGWVVRETADGPALKRTSTRAGAVALAKDQLFRGRGGQLDVHEADGTVVETCRVAPRGRRPWWYAPPRLSSMVVGAFFVIEGVIELDFRPSLLPWIGWLLLAAGSVQVLSFVVSRTADRRLRADQEPPEKPYA